MPIARVTNAADLPIACGDGGVLRRFQRGLASAVMIALLAATSGGGSTQARADDWIIGSASANPQPALPPVYSFTIERQTLAKALTIFTETTGVQLVYESAVAANRVSPGLIGKTDSTTALHALLIGTGLVPSQLFPGGFVLAPPGSSPTFANAPPIDAPMLQLRSLHVTAPDPENHALYGMTVQYAIQSALQRDEVIRRNQYNANIMVWLTPAGGVQNSSFLISTGDPSLDAMIGEAVRKVAIGQSPPYDMPQPVYVRILSLRRRG